MVKNRTNMKYSNWSKADLIEEISVLHNNYNALCTNNERQYELLNFLCNELSRRNNLSDEDINILISEFQKNLNYKEE